MTNASKRPTITIKSTHIGQTKQSFSRGQEKNVIVETKTRRRGGAKPFDRAPAPGAQPRPAPRPPRDPRGRRLSDAELERRKQALKMEGGRAEEERRRQIEDRKRAEEAKKREELARLQQPDAPQPVVSMEAAVQPAVKAEAPAAKRPPRKDSDGKRGAPGRKSGRREPHRDRNSSGKGGQRQRRKGKITLTQALDNGGDRQRQPSIAAMKRRQQRERQRASGAAPLPEKIIRDVQIPETIIVQELANRMAERVGDVVKALLTNGIMVTQNQVIDADTAELIVGEFGHRVARVSAADVEDVIDKIEDRPEDLRPRPPIITVMGHVDHGKTSLLDAIRNTKLISSEAGGITQHIGAYQVQSPSGGTLTFLDTPGHAAFTAMRARGAQITDIVVLVVAADDSVMPQTVEAIHHAKAANVPIIVAINKMDKDGADPAKVRSELLQHSVIVEKMSGDVLDVEISASTGKNIDQLLETILLQAELLELRANPDRVAKCTVIEAKLDIGRGPVATVMVERGTLRQGDIFVVGQQWGKVRALLDESGTRIEGAEPSRPVEILGLNGTPQAGDVLNVVESEAQAREISSYRSQLAKDRRNVTTTKVNLDDLIAKAKTESEISELPVVVKADVRGSAEAISQALEKIGNDEVRVRVLHSGVGAITESDVTLAEASGAPLVGFNVRANAPARVTANQKGVDIRYYSVIYDLTDDIKKAASGLLSDEIRETIIGNAHVKEVFRISGTGNVAGCLVTDGAARKSAGVRLLRDSVVIHEGTLKTLKRFKDEVEEVTAGQECGMAFQSHEDIRPDDTIEIFERQEFERNLE